METTFGRSDYVFPDFEETCQRIHAFCDRANVEKKTPVLLAYSLGKAQELMKIIESRSQALMVYKTIASLNQVYASFGVSMPQTRPLDFLNMSESLVVMPPSVLNKLPRKDLSLIHISEPTRPY